MGFDMAGKAEAERRGWGMVLRERDPNEMPEDIAAVGAAVLKERDPYRVIGERLAELVRTGSSPSCTSRVGVRRCRHRC
ncbi:MAG: hypothetical protein U0893_17490 [Chloroflexota bacterium]